MTRVGAALAVTMLVGCEWVADPQAFTQEEAPRFRAHAEHPAPPAAPTRLKVMSWNVKYGACRVDFWFDFWGDRTQLSSTEVDDCLSKLAALIREVDPDVLLTQEIEVGSKRSAYVDMVRYFLENTNLRYAAYGETWDSRYVPLEGVGRINLGNAVFSRYPITAATRIRQVDRTDQDPLTSTFYLKRSITRAELEVGTQTVSAYVVHTEAYDSDGTKQQQIAQIHGLLTAEPKPWLAGGDWNELPPVCDETIAGDCDGKLRLSGFLDERASAKGTEFEQPPYTPSVMKPFYDDFEPFISLARYGVGEAQQRPYFTHDLLSPDALNDEGVPGFWNRTLDYLFVRKGEVWENTEVLQTAGRAGIVSDPLRLSDHAPIIGTWVLP